VPQRLYETGDIDATGVGADYIDMVTDPEGAYLSQLNIYPELSFSYVGFNCTKPPFDDPNIRRAFALAVDKAKLASLLFKDMVTPASGILPSGMPGYNAQLKGLDYNIALAKDLIKQSKYGSASNLPAITITTSGYGAAASATLTAMLYDWKQNLGVDVKIRVLEPEVFFYTLKSEKDELFDIGWIADYPHPQDFLEILFKSGGDNNWGEYSNAEVDALLNQAGIEPDNAKSLRLYQQAEQKLVDDAACIPLWFGKNYLLTKPYVSGYAPNAMGIVKLNKVSVNK
jgi:oligopeptide transport system substrate-binding protein